VSDDRYQAPGTRRGCGEARGGAAERHRNRGERRWISGSQAVIAIEPSLDSQAALHSFKHILEHPSGGPQDLLHCRSHEALHLTQHAFNRHRETRPGRKLESLCPLLLRRPPFTSVQSERSGKQDRHPKRAISRWFRDLASPSPVAPPIPHTTQPDSRKYGLSVA
jgi:hypothetical protein